MINIVGARSRWHLGGFWVPVAALRRARDVHYERVSFCLGHQFAKRTVVTGSTGSISARRRWHAADRETAVLDVIEYIEGFYNPTRRHSYLGGVSPIEFEAAHRSRRSRRPLNPGNSIPLNVLL